jgi:hypothetical protein
MAGSTETTGSTETSGPEHSRLINLNSDGRSHPLLNLTSVGTLIIGLVSFALGMLLRYDAGATGKGFAISAAVTGLVTLVVGLYAQMISATREERILLVTGMVAGFVGLALGLAHGGFSG